MLKDMVNKTCTVDETVLNNSTVVSGTLSNNSCTLDELLPDDVTQGCVVSTPIGDGDIVLACILAVIVSITIVGNLLVIIAILKYKNLQTTFNYYVLNLAITDFAVGVSAMTFYSVDRVMGCWPFGTFMCGVWIFFDYGMTFASVFTLVAISIDRYWSVARPIHYQKHNKKSKVVIALVVVWAVMLTIWLPPCIIDRIKWSEPYKCIWEPSNNKEFVVFVAIIGHHLPDIILAFCYVNIFRKMRVRAKVRPTIGGHYEGNSVPLASVSQAYAETMSTYPSESGYTQSAAFPGEVTKTSATQDSNFLSIAGSEGKKRKRKRKKQRDPEKERDRRERKVFIMLTYIIAGYAICWIPFHFVFDISAIHPEWISETAYAIFFYMTYANSTINPFLYHASNAEFRRAFAKLLKCR